MLKLFYVITTLIVLVKSEVSVDWICEETNSMGNCSTMPKITEWLQVLSDDIDSDEYTDLHYCPFEIVERHSRCMVAYLSNCQGTMSDAKRHFIYSYVPRAERAGTHCTKGRAFKNEFREHTDCMRAMFSGQTYYPENPWHIQMVNQEVEFGILSKKLEYSEKCEVYHRFWETQMSWIRKSCGVKSEKFSRQVLSNMWPIMGLLNICGDRLSTYGYFET